MTGKVAATFAAQHRIDGVCGAIAFRPDRKPARDRRSSSPSSSARSRATPATSGLTAAAWNRRSHADRARGMPHWPQWLRAIPAAKRPNALMRLFAALFLLLPGGALVVSTHRHAHAALTSAVLLFVVAHAAPVSYTHLR